MNCGHAGLTQQKAEMGTWQDRSVSWLHYLHVEADPGRRIPTSTNEDEFPMKKCGVLHFGGNNLRNGTDHSLDQFLNMPLLSCAEIDCAISCLCTD